MKKQYPLYYIACSLRSRFQYLQYIGIALLVGCFLVFSKDINAQQTDSLKTGRITGKVKDSAYKFMLISATVAVYKAADSSLVQFSLSNNLGEFTIPALPLDAPLRMIITHVGYKPRSQSFVLTKDKRTLDAGLLHMYQNTDAKGNMLEEVVVKAVPPLRMKGDTLEFNADAFKMDPNATAEDLMRRLPGFTIWGDGEITFNGKKIIAVLVEGKPFMGSADPTIATQNLSKEALDKIQVYQQVNERNLLDSNMYANIKLKGDKKTGYFGKVSGGYGVSGSSPGEDNRYVADGMFSGFNRKMQFAAVAGGNNVNKIAGNVDALLRTNSFKGEGNSLEYQSDFTMAGVNKPVMAGVRFQYDFMPEPLFRQISRLRVDYFLNHNNRQVVNNSLESNFITADTLLSRQSNSAAYNRTSDQRVSAGYERSTDKYSLQVNTAASVNDAENRYTSENSQDKTGVGNINSSSSASRDQRLARNIAAGFSLYKYEDRTGSGDRTRIPTAFRVAYNLRAGTHTGNGQSETIYQFANDPQRNRRVSRLYDRRNGYYTEHDLDISYPQLRQLIFGKRGLGGIDIGLSAKYQLGIAGNHDQVRDMDTTTGQYVVNSGLSFNRTITTSDFMPAVNLSKLFTKVLTNRYDKSLSLQLNLVQQYYGYTSSSTQAKQNMAYRVNKFVPDAAIEYNNDQYGAYEETYKLAYTSQVMYPNIDQVAPLIDLANPLYRPMGNRYLKPAYQRDIRFDYTFDTRTPRNPWKIDAGVRIGKTTDQMVDSTIYDSNGGRIVYMTNINGSRYLSSHAGVAKSLALNKNNTFECGVRYNYELSRDQQYIDAQLNVSVNQNHGGSVDMNYRYRDWVNLKVEQGFSYNNARQRGFDNNRFNSGYRYTRAIATWQIPKGLTWNSNITHNLSEAGNSESVRFTIWNASLTYRFLKGDNGEVKFSALDLLRQNKGITVSAIGNVQQMGYTNVLQQYFMLTLSFYPRKFGK